MKLKDISIILMTLGFATIVSSFLDFYTYMYPVAIKNPEWVFDVSQRIADTTLLPVLGILIFLLGLNFSNFRRNKIITTSAKVVFGSLCVLFFSFLSLNTILYGISMKSVQNTKIQALKAENNNSKERINTVYNQNKKDIPVEEYNIAMKQLNDNLIYQINYLNLIHTKINIKTLLTLLLFSFVYLIAAIKIFSLDKLLQKRRTLLR
ncbi:MAG: hypothetical protein A2039_06945 [Candidatus Melainabacteria bacterium GWA2_34_9]|nr:MAG: hypothetical protein A2039_06945 [Candidatus Melainabacteria bacterium GWA2_34_9]